MSPIREEKRGALTGLQRAGQRGCRRPAGLSAAGPGSPCSALGGPVLGGSALGGPCSLGHPGSQGWRESPGDREEGGACLCGICPRWCVRAFQPHLPAGAPREPAAGAAWLAEPMSVVLKGTPAGQEPAGPGGDGGGACERPRLPGRLWKEAHPPCLPRALTRCSADPALPTLLCVLGRAASRPRSTGRGSGPGPQEGPLHVLGSKRE